MDYGSALEIERPRSALHSGDFREESPVPHGQQSRAVIRTDGRPAPPPSSSPWEHLSKETSTPSNSPFPQDGPDLSHSFKTLNRSRAPSCGSFSSSYVLKPPTSPLIHQANNPDLDFSLKDDPMDLSDSPQTLNRRRTMPPEAFQPPSLSSSASTSYARKLFGHRRESSFPYQAHQPRRSVTSMYTLQAASSLQIPDFLRSRRLSHSSEASPLQHASMVGSYEESILRGRMSTTPSKPLDFTAQIGVLGKGNCKSNLRCPPHVTVPFPAVFYSYSTSGVTRNISDDSPSPYVGFIDLENTLRSERKPSQRVRKTVSSPRKCPCHPSEGGEITPQPPLSQQEIRAREKRSRRSKSPISLPGGCYRIPQQGQLQIIIKNPNKTAVKLFLVPYDLDGMEPGSKTFIRQRSYSIGPAVEIPIKSNTNPDGSESAGSTIPPDTLEDKPILRYLIHLNICCPSRGRYYLYSGIRVVFANRVPDGKEKLRNEVQYPDPRYSPYKPSRENHRHVSDKATRRRSSGFGRGMNDPVNLLDFNSPDSMALQRSPTPHRDPNLSLPFSFANSGFHPSNVNNGKEGERKPSHFFHRHNWHDGTNPYDAVDDLSVSPEQPPVSPLSSKFLNWKRDGTKSRDIIPIKTLPPFEGNSNTYSPAATPGAVSPSPDTGFRESLLSRELRDMDVQRRIP